MGVRRIAARLLFIGSATIGLLALWSVWQAYSWKRHLSSMAADSRAELIDICRTPGVDCMDHVDWLMCALVFGLPAIELAIASWVVAPSTGALSSSERTQGEVVRRHGRGPRAPGPGDNGGN